MKRVAVWGLGALGTVFADRFARTPGVEVCAVMDDERARQCRETPPTLNGVPLPLSPESFRAEPPQDWTGADLVVAAVKFSALRHAARFLRPWLRRDGSTVLFPVLNGLDALEYLRDSLGPAAAVYLDGFVLCNSAERDVRDVRQSGAFRVLVGGDGAPVAARAAARLAGFLRSAGLDADAPDDFLAAKWRKWILNVALNQAEALLGLNHGQLLANPDAMAFFHALAGEAIAVARAAGASGIDDAPAALDAALKMLSPDGKTSMLQDVLAQRPTEAPAFAGAVCRLAQKYGIPAPANRLVLDCFSPSSCLTRK